MEKTKGIRYRLKPNSKRKLLASIVAVSFMMASFFTLLLNASLTPNSASAVTSSIVRDSLDSNSEIEKFRFVQVDKGVEHYIGLTTNGDVYTWGKNTHGQLGFTSIPTSTTEGNITGTTVGNMEIKKPQLLIKASLTDEKYTSAENGAQSLRHAFTQLTGSTSYSSYNQINFMGWCPLNERVVEVAALEYGNVARTTSGRLVYWGDNSYGQFGTATDFSESSTVNGISGLNLGFTFSNKGYAHTSVIPRPRVVHARIQAYSVGNLANFAPTGAMTNGTNYGTDSNAVDRVNFTSVSAGARHFVATGTYTNVLNAAPTGARQYFFTFGDTTYGQAYKADGISDVPLDQSPAYYVLPLQNNYNTSQVTPYLNAGKNDEAEKGNDSVPFSRSSLANSDISIFAYAGANSTIYYKSDASADSRILVSGKNYVGYKSPYTTELDTSILGTLGMKDASSSTTIAYTGRRTTQTSASESKGTSVTRFYTHYLANHEVALSTNTLGSSSNGYKIYNALDAGRDSSPQGQTLFPGLDSQTIQGDSNYLGGYNPSVRHRISIGNDFGFAVKNDKDLLAWGYNLDGAFSNLFAAQTDKSGNYERVDFVGGLGASSDYRIRSVAAGRYKSFISSDSSETAEFVNAVLLTKSETSSYSARKENKVYVWGNVGELNSLPIELDIPGKPSIVSIKSVYGAELLMLSDTGKLYIYRPKDNVNQFSIVDFSVAQRSTGVVGADRNTPLKIDPARKDVKSISMTNTASTNPEIRYLNAAARTTDNNGVLRSTDGDALRWVIPTKKGSANNEAVNSTIRFNHTTSGGPTSLVGESVGAGGNRKILDSDNNQHITSVQYYVQFYEYTDSSDSYGDSLSTDESSKYSIDDPIVKQYADIDFVYIHTSGGSALDLATATVPSSGYDTASTNRLFTGGDVMLKVQGRRRAKFRLTAYIAEYEKYNTNDYTDSSDKTTFFYVHEVSLFFEINNSLPTKNTNVKTDMSSDENIMSNYRLDANVNGFIVKPKDASLNALNNLSGDKVIYSFADIYGNPSSSLTADAADYYVGLYGMQRYLNDKLSRYSGGTFIGSGGGFSSGTYGNLLYRGQGSSNETPSTSFVVPQYYDYLATDPDGDVLSPLLDGSALQVDNESYPEYLGYLFLNQSTINAVSVDERAISGSFYSFDTYTILLNDTGSSERGAIIDLLDNYTKLYRYGNFTIEIPVNQPTDTKQINIIVRYSRIIFYAKKAIPSGSQNFPEMSFFVNQQKANTTPTTQNQMLTYAFAFKPQASTALRVNTSFKNKVRVDSAKSVTIGDSNDSSKFFLGTTTTVNLEELFTDSTDLYFDASTIAYDDSAMTVTTAKDSDSEYNKYDRLLMVEAKRKTSESGAMLTIQIAKIKGDSSGLSLEDSDRATISFSVKILDAYEIKSYEKKATTTPQGKAIENYFASQEGINHTYTGTDFFYFVVPSLSPDTVSSRTMKIVSVKSSDTRVLSVTLSQNTLRFMNNNTGKIRLFITVTDGYTTYSQLFDDLEVKGVYVGGTFKINSSYAIVAADIAGYCDDLKLDSQVSFQKVDISTQLEDETTETFSTVSYTLFNANGEVIFTCTPETIEGENPYFSARYQASMLYIDPIKTTTPMTAVFDIVIDNTAQKVKVTIEIWKFDAINKNTQERTVHKMVVHRGSGRKSQLRASDVIDNDRVTPPQPIATASARITDVRLISSSDITTPLVDFTYDSNNVYLEAKANGTQEIQLIMYDNANYFSVNVIVEVEGITTVLELTEYITIFGLCALGCFVVLVTILVIRFIAYSKKLAHQKRIIKKNRMLINLRDRMHNKTNKASKEDLVRTRIAMADTKYAAQFDKMRRQKEMQTGILLANSKVAQNASIKATQEKDNKLANKKMMDQVRAKMLAQKAQEKNKKTQQKMNQKQAMAMNTSPVNAPPPMPMNNMQGMPMQGMPNMQGMPMNNGQGMPMQGMANMQGAPNNAPPVMPMNDFLNNFNANDNFNNAFGSSTNFGGAGADPRAEIENMIKAKEAMEPFDFSKFEG